MLHIQGENGDKILEFEDIKEASLLHFKLLYIEDLEENLETT